MIDTYRHQSLRSKLIDKLRNDGIKDENVLKAMNEVPRHFFFESAFADYAYEDKPFPIAAGQTISQPYTVARQSELLKVKRGMRVMEIGTGSGYQASVLIKMGAKVFTIERQVVLYRKVVDLFKTLPYTPYYIKYGDGYEGFPKEDPFDRIIVTAGAPDIPKKLLAQLKIGGIMVIPVGVSTQTMYRITRIGQNEFEQEDFGSYRFVPMLEDREDEEGQ
jgi:protein-L-isoaspartate(D-aspartate) O-methyltransferase